MTGKDFSKRLERDGWRLVRVKGSHHIYEKESRTEKISVPIHGSRELKKGLLKYLTKIADGESDDAARDA